MHKNICAAGILKRRDAQASQTCVSTKCFSTALHTTSRRFFFRCFIFSNPSYQKASRGHGNIIILLIFCSLQWFNINFLLAAVCRWRLAAHNQRTPNKVTLIDFDGLDSFWFHCLWYDFFVCLLLFNFFFFTFLCVFYLKRYTEMEKLA